MTTHKPILSSYVRERAVRRVLQPKGGQSSLHTSVRSIVVKLECSAEDLRDFTQKAERDKGWHRAIRLQTSARESRPSIARSANYMQGTQDPTQGERCSYNGEARPPFTDRVACIDKPRHDGEPTRRVPPIAQLKYRTIGERRAIPQSHAHVR